MVTKRSRKSESSETQLTEAVEVVAIPSELILHDIRVLKLHSERFLTPEEASRGTFSLSVDEGELDLPDESSSPYLATLLYSVKLDGFKISEKSPKLKTDRTKSFSVAIELEAKFEIIGVTKAPSVEEISPMLNAIIGEVHVFAVERLRIQAADLGYRAVRPSLGRKKAFANLVEK
ncbi:hypothetical protein RugamoR64_16250 [Duganella rhizosphaerae]|uniref:hypothetical protein n=1 Tax=Duganella rhizosphaerae TaxID=2885763 RepID=UPI0030E87BE1